MSETRKRIEKLAVGALFCALTLVATYVSVPTPGFGNVNLGDGAILLCTFLTGSPWMAIAAATGAALCDLLSAYTIYAPGTFVIKGAMVLLAILADRLLRRVRVPKFLCRILASLLSELVMVLGYFVYECWILQYGFAAAANIPFNCVQGGVAILLANIAIPLIEKTKLARWF